MGGDTRRQVDKLTHRGRQGSGPDLSLQVFTARACQQNQEVALGRRELLGTKLMTTPPYPPVFSNLLKGSPGHR